MIWYDLGIDVDAFSTNIGDDISAMEIVTPMHQAHSTNVAVIPAEKDNTHGVDALITNSIGVAIGVRTADCVPVLIYDPISKAIAAIHSGWKGTANNIIAHTVEKMQKTFGSHASCMKAAIGPCIHVEAFEVGDEVYEVFRSKGYTHHAKRMTNPYDTNSEAKWHIDLVAICREQLAHCGIRDAITSPHCTYRDHDQFYSYRHCKCSDRAHRIITGIRLK